MQHLPLPLSSLLCRAGCILEIQQPAYEYEHKINMLKVAKQKDKQLSRVSVFCLFGFGFGYVCQVQSSGFDIWSKIMS